jgi:hypothetical protein
VFVSAFRTSPASTFSPDGAVPKPGSAKMCCSGSGMALSAALGRMYRAAPVRWPGPQWPDPSIM